MILIPAIDLMGGRAVRLAQGERDAVTTYEADPVQVARGFARAGAKQIHVVDLDGAFAERPSQRETIRDIAKAAHDEGAQVQTGGGIRDEASIAAAIEAGADRVVIGTLALRSPELAEQVCTKYADTIVVAADARDGLVAVTGWQEQSDTKASDLAKRAEDWGAAAILFTDVARDGMQTGPAVDATVALQNHVDIDVYASGGVGTLAHIDACKEAGIRGVIVGRALYEGSFELEEALTRC